MGRFENAEVFRNPKVVAAAAKTVIGDYLHAFRAIEFAGCCRPGDSANYDAFVNALTGV